MEVRVIEKIKNFFECECETLCWDYQVGVGGLAAAGLTIAADFYLGFPAAG
jgi:hypothetical protein